MNQDLADYEIASSTFGGRITARKPKDSDVVIVCSNEGGGLKPEKLLLWGQVYMEEWQDTPGLTLVPVRASEYIQLGAVGDVRGRTLRQREGATVKQAQEAENRAKKTLKREKTLQEPIACVKGCGLMTVEPSFVKEGERKRLVSVTFTCDSCGRVMRRMASGGRGSMFVVEEGAD